MFPGRRKGTGSVFCGFCGLKMTPIVIGYNTINNQTPGHVKRHMTVDVVLFCVGLCFTGGRGGALPSNKLMAMCRLLWLY